MSSEEQYVPKGVLRGIEDIANGRTMSEEEVLEVLSDE